MNIWLGFGPVPNLQKKKKKKMPKLPKERGGERRKRDMRGVEGGFETKHKMNGKTE